MATTVGRFEPKSRQEKAEPLLGGNVSGTRNKMQNDGAGRSTVGSSGGGVASAATTASTITTTTTTTATPSAEPVGDAVLSNRMLGVYVVRLEDGVKLASFCDFIPPKEPQLQSRMAKMVDFGRELVQTKVIPKLIKTKSREPTRASLLDSSLRFTFVTGPLCAFIAVTSMDYPQSTAFVAMSSLRDFIEHLRKPEGSRKAVDINLCKPKGLSKHCVNVFAELRLKFSASMDSSAIAKAKEAMKRTTLRLEESIEKQLQLQVETEALRKNLEELKDETTEFKEDTQHWHEEAEQRNKVCFCCHKNRGVCKHCQQGCCCTIS